MSNKLKPLAKVGDIETYTNKDGTEEKLQACQVTGLCEGCVHCYDHGDAAATCCQMSHCYLIIWKEAVC